MKRILGAALLFVTTTAAHADQNMDNLQAMYMLGASSEVCGLPMSEAEAAKLEKASTLLEGRLNYDEAQAKAFYDRVKTAVEEQKDTLCAADGEWAKTYAAALAGLPD